jgi:hypothetical protein
VRALPQHASQLTKVFDSFLKKKRCLAAFNARRPASQTHYSPGPDPADDDPDQ